MNIQNAINSLLFHIFSIILGICFPPTAICHFFFFYIHSSFLRRKFIDISPIINILAHLVQSLFKWKLSKEIIITCGAMFVQDISFKMAIAISHHLFEMICSFHRFEFKCQAFDKAVTHSLTSGDKWAKILFLLLFQAHKLNSYLIATKRTEERAFTI